MSKNDIVPYSNNLPALSQEVMDCLPHLPAHRQSSFLDLFRSDTRIMQLDTEYVVEHGRYLDARINQIQKTRSLLRERIGVASDIADMENAIIEIQRSKEHERWMSEASRNAAKVEGAYNHKIAVTNKETELARAQERLVRARRNVDAAERLAPGQVDEWYAAQEAKKANAFAERQDALADLAQPSLAIARSSSRHALQHGTKHSHRARPRPKANPTAGRAPTAAAKQTAHRRRR